MSPPQKPAAGGPGGGRGRSLDPGPSGVVRRVATRSKGARGRRPDSDRSGADRAGAARRAGARATRGCTLAAARSHARSLPGTGELPHFKVTSFRVRGRIYATAPPEGGLLHVFVNEQARQAAIALAPEAVGLLRWGAKVVGVRVNLALASAARIERLLEQAWSERAPKAVAAAWEGR